jgi:hypothetical protein
MSVSVVSLAGRPGYRPDFRSIASARMRSARQNLGLSEAEFSAYLTDAVGWPVRAGTVARWEDGSMLPGDVLMVCQMASGSGTRKRLRSATRKPLPEATRT